MVASLAQFVLFQIGLTKCGIKRDKNIVKKTMHALQTKLLFPLFWFEGFGVNTSPQSLAISMCFGLKTLCLP